MIQNTTQTCFLTFNLAAAVEDMHLGGSFVYGGGGDGYHGEATVVDLFELHGALVLVSSLVEDKGFAVEVAGQVVVVGKHLGRTQWM